MSAPAVDAVRAAIGAFGNRPDPRLGVVDPWDPPSRPAAALLASVLGQDLTIAGLARLLREIHRGLGGRSLEATTPDWGALEKFSARAGWLRDWAHREALAGWILSASDFLRTHGAPEAWPARFSPAELVRALAAEIPWMGARSAHRIKAWRLCRWLGRGEIGPGWPDRTSLRVPHPAVERPLKAISVLPAQWDGWTGPRRQEWVDRIVSDASPTDPAAAWSALDAILSRGRGAPACQEHLGGCTRCPLRSRCPSPAFP